MKGGMKSMKGGGGRAGADSGDQLVSEGGVRREAGV